jgi:hypothetical protein
MTELPVVKAIIDPRFCPMSRALEMKLSNHATVIAGVSYQFGDDWMSCGKGLITISRVV